MFTNSTICGMNLRHISSGKRGIVICNEKNNAVIHLIPCPSFRVLTIRFCVAEIGGMDERFTPVAFYNTAEGIADVAQLALAYLSRFFSATDKRSATMETFIKELLSDYTKTHQKEGSAP